MSHTPGPWAVSPDEWTERRTLIITGPVGGAQSAHLREIAYIGDTENDGTQSGADATDYANARLIAAAPDMLEACLVAVACGQPEKASLYDEEGVEGWIWNHPDGREWAEIGDWNEPAPMHPLIIEAIAKAEGRTP